MAESNASLQPPSIAIRLEFVDADPRQPDPATTGDVARSAVDGLRAAGYTIAPVYTGAKGGELFEIASQFVQFIQDNKEWLTALLGLATPIVKYFFGRRESKQDSPQNPPTNVNVAVVIDGMSVDVQSEDMVDVNRFLARLQQAHPNLVGKMTPSSTLSIRVHVPPRHEAFL